MNEAPAYRRVVLGMSLGGIDRRILRAAAEFARLLELEMLGIFVEDRAVLGLADLPFARELRLPGHDWQALDPQRLIDELRAAAEQAHRLFDQEVALQGVSCQFEVRRGDPATLASAVAGTSDILVVAEPAAAADWLASAIMPAQRAALASPAAVLLLPPSAILWTGPMAVVAAGSSDPAFALASRIAKATGEELVVVPPSDDMSAVRLIASLQRALGPRRERLLILPRPVSGLFDETLLQLAARLNVPVLAT